MAGLDAHAANSGSLLARCSRVITNLQVAPGPARRPPAPPQPPPPPPCHNHPSLAAPAAQVDVGGLLWEIDQRQGSSFHEEVAAGLPGILAAAHAAAAGAGEGAGSGSGSNGASRPASPEDAGRLLLRAAEDRVGLLQRAYVTITGLQVRLDACCLPKWVHATICCNRAHHAATWVLPPCVQTDVDACLWELEAGSSAHLDATPLPFPSLTPLGHGHSTLTLSASAAPGPPSSAAQAQPLQPGSGGAEGLAALAASAASPTEWQHEGSSAASSLGAPPAAHVPLPDEQEAARFVSSTGDGSGGGTPPSQQAQQPRRAEPPAALSPTTTAFVGAAYAARDTEAAEHAAQPRAVLDTSLKDADVQTGRCAGGLLAG